MLAIHDSNRGFHPRWRNYCIQNKIPFKSVNCYKSDVVRQLEGCDVLLWHYGQNIAADIIVAKQILFALEHTGFKIFPDFNTAWHFNDKVAQKYLLERINAPLVPSYVFFNMKDALKWLENTEFPLVWKLRGGAGSNNVRLIRSKGEAKKMVMYAFTNGFRNFDSWSLLKDRVGKAKGKEVIFEFLKGIRRLLLRPYYDKVMGKELGYIYFQKYLKDNDSDTRIIVIGNRAFAIKRYNRKNDFRASGSGDFDYNKDLIDERCVKIAFDLNKKIKSQSIAYDFIFDQKNEPYLVEISYGFISEVYDPCEGYWDKDLNFHQTEINPQGWIIENLIYGL